jgi:hypothetical protein
MEANRIYPLGDALRRRAEAFFGASFARVGLRVDEAALGPGVAAMAAGDTIYLSPRLAGAPRPWLEVLLGHELAHVVQQRHGRARPRFTHGGFAIADDPALEREADDLGWRFVHAPHDRPPPAGDPRVTAPVIAQRSVRVANQQLTEIAALSESARLCLGLIPQGLDWLAWAISDTTRTQRFADEEQLVEAAAVGLHASSLVGLPTIGLLASASRLVQLPPAALQVLATAEGGNASSVVTVQIKHICAQERLVLQADLDLGMQFLTEIGVGNPLVLQAMSLADQIALYGLVDSSRSGVAMQPALQTEAAAFAVAQAATPLELLDYYRTYLELAAKLGTLDKTPGDRARSAQAAVDTLRPLLHGALAGLEGPGFVSPTLLQQRIRDLQRAGHKIGFARLSAGVAQMVQHTVFKEQRGDAARALVNGAVDEANAFIADAQPGVPELAQDGASAAYPLQTERLVGELTVDSAGIVTLSFLRPREAPTTTATPPGVVPLAPTSAPQAPPARKATPP